MSTSVAIEGITDVRWTSSFVRCWTQLRHGLADRTQLRLRVVSSNSSSTVNLRGNNFCSKALTMIVSSVARFGASPNLNVSAFLLPLRAAIPRASLKIRCSA